MSKEIESIYIQDYNSLPNVRKLKVCSKHELYQYQHEYSLSCLTLDFLKQGQQTKETALFNTILFKYQNTEMVVCYKDELIRCRSAVAAKVLAEQERLRAVSNKVKKPKDPIATLTKLLEGMPPKVVAEIKKQMLKRD